MGKDKQFNFITYGSRVTSLQIEDVLQHLMHRLIDKTEERVTSFCIWGMHGIGKSDLVKAYAQKAGYEFIYIAPAQFEEMGDLTGMPRIEVDSDGKSVTRLIPPQWVPKTEGPGIFLIDDVNRADDRILRGIMQLLQNYELVSWKLPAQWAIVLTANPDGGDYSVTTMDDAMITRMIHVTMEFDVKAWAKWAESAGVDPRGIDFVLTYPEIVNGNRTTPRSLVQFFKSIEAIPDLTKRLNHVKIFADGCLDAETTVAFINFINMDMDKLVAPEEILNAGEFKMIEGRLNTLVNGTIKRMDILSVTMTRLTNYVLVDKHEIDSKSFENLKRFILLDFIPNDLRLAMAQELVSSSKKELKKLYTIPEIGKLILTKM